MFSHSLSNTQLVFALLNMAGASAAMIVNYLAYRRTGFSGPRLSYAITATFAGFYAVAYLVLAFTDIPPSDWSSVMRGVSVPIWPLVWSSHAAAKVWSNGPHRWADAVIEEVERRLDGDA